MGIEIIKEYFESMEHYEDSWVIKVKYNDKWAAYSSDDGKINAIEDEEKPHEGYWWYYAKDNDATVEDIIKLIKETVELNMEMAKKAKLFTQKADDLRKIFSDTKYSYNELLSLKFVFGETKETKPTTIKETKKKPVRKTKKDVLKEIPIVQEESEDAMTVKMVEPEKVRTAKQHKIEAKDGKANAVIQKKDAVVVNATDMTDDEINDLRG